MRKLKHRFINYVPNATPLILVSNQNSLWTTSISEGEPTLSSPTPAVCLPSGQLPPRRFGTRSFQDIIASSRHSFTEKPAACGSKRGGWRAHCSTHGDRWWDPVTGCSPVLSTVPTRTSLSCHLRWASRSQLQESGLPVLALLSAALLGSRGALSFSLC